MANSIMKMAFVINGTLSNGFTSAVSRAQNQLKAMNDHVEKLNKHYDIASHLQKNAFKPEHAERFKEKLKRIGAEVEKTSKSWTHLNNLLNSRNESKALFDSSKINFFSTLQTFRPLTGFLSEAYESAANFEKAMAKVGAISLGDVKGEEYNKQLQLLTKTARELGEKTQFTATQSAEAMSYLGMAGWKTNQIIEGMPALLDLAVAGGADLARTADIISDELTAFGLGADKARHMADVFAVTITSTNTDVEKLGETMKYAAPVAYAFGASMEETAAMAGLMAGKAIKASQAGTSLRTGLMRLAGPPKMAQKAMDELGLSMEDLTAEQKEAALALKSLGIETGNTQGAQKMAIILNSLREKMAGLTKEEKTAMVAAVFGKNAAAGWLAMIDAEEGAFEKLLESLYKSDGAAARVAERMNATTKGALTRMKSAYESLQISVMNGFLPALTSVFEWTAKQVSAASKLAAEYPRVTKAIVGIIVAGAGFVTITAGISLATNAAIYAYDSFMLWKQGIWNCIKAFKVQTVVTKASAAAMKAYSAAQVIATGVGKALLAVNTAMNTALAATPIGWIIVGIAALIVAGTLLYKHWEKVKAFFTNLWESPTARTMMFITGPIGWVIGITSAIIANWDTLKAYFEYFWDNPSAALFRFQNWAQETFQNAVNAGREKWNELKAVLDKPIFATFVAPAWDSLKNSASQAYESITAKIGTAFDGVKTSIGNALESAKQTILNLPETIAYGIGYAAGYLYDSLTQLPGKVMTLVQQAGRFLSDLPNACYQAGVNFLNRLSTWASQAYDSMVNFLTQTVTSAWDFLMNLPETCYQAGMAFINRLTTWGGEAFAALVTWLTNMVNSAKTFLWNLPTICMEAGRNFVSAAAQWAQDAYNSIMEWITRLPEAISNTISNAWEGIKAKFSAGFTVGVSAANNGAPVAANAKGGIYNKGAFLTTFAERSPEAAIPIDNSERAKGLWMRVGQMLGMLQRPQRNTAPVLKLPQIFPAGTGYDPKPLAIPNIPIMPELSAPELPDIQPQKETLIERVKEFVAPTVRNRISAPAPNVTINNSFHFTGAANQQEIRETVERSADISYAKFREMMLQFQHEQRRTAYE